jgi:hypothetical protein
MKYVKTVKITREDIAELKACGFYVEYCDTGTRLLSVDVFVLKAD